MNPEQKFLIDTSIWILSFKPNGPEAMKKEVEILLSEQKVLTSEVIILELVRGIPSKKEFAELLEDFAALVTLPLDGEAWRIAFELSFMMKRQGKVIPAVDIVIASLAIQHKVVLFHADKHFHLIAEKSSLKERYYEIGGEII